MKRTLSYFKNIWLAAGPKVRKECVFECGFIIHSRYSYSHQCTPVRHALEADFTNEDGEGSMGVRRLSMGLSGTFEVRGNREISRKGETLTGCAGVCTPSHGVGS